MHGYKALYLNCKIDRQGFRPFGYMANKATVKIMKKNKSNIILFTFTVLEIN